MTQSLKNPDIILASSSLSRKAQLQALGFQFQVCPPHIDEDRYKALPESRESICQKIARAKAEKVAKKYPAALTVAGDQMAVLGTQIFNKAPTPERAVQALKKLQGKTHRLLTALHICYEDKTFSHLQINVMQMRPLSESQIKRYVEVARPTDCAGSYALERKGIGLFEKIQTEDQNAVVGLPLITFINQLVKWNIRLPFL